MQYRGFYVYILTNKRNTALYIGFTSNLVARIYQHRKRVGEGFTKKYYLTQLVYYEIYATATEAITREKQLKKFTRSRKEELISRTNPTWRDLSDDL